MRETERGKESERGRTTPSSSSGCDSERRRYLDQSNHAAGSAFYHYFTCFPFTSPSLDDIPRAISRDKKGARAQKRIPCLLPAAGGGGSPVPSWYPPWSSRHLLRLGYTSPVARTRSRRARARKRATPRSSHERSLTV